MHGAPARGDASHNVFRSHFVASVPPSLTGAVNSGVRMSSPEASKSSCGLTRPGRAIVPITPSWPILVGGRDTARLVGLRRAGAPSEMKAA